MKFYILALIFLSCSAFGSAAEPVEHIHIDLGDVIHKIQNFFSFLCSRCKEVVAKIDSAIDSESLKKDANALCQTLLGFNEVVEKVCKSVVEDVLGEVYTQLKKLEPNDAFCTHLHLCDACLVPAHTTRRPFKHHEPVDTSKLLHGKLHHFSLDHNHTDSS